MEYSREVLIRALKLTVPIASASSSIILHKHVWFLSTHIGAFNGTVGVSVPTDTGISAGIDGKILLNFLQKISLETVDLSFSDTDRTLTVRAGKSVVKLASVEPEEHILESILVDTKGTWLALPRALLQPTALAAMLSVNPKSADDTPEVNALTLIYDAESDRLVAYTTDRQTIRRRLLKTPTDTALLKVLETHRLMIPTSFLGYVSKIDMDILRFDIGGPVVLIEFEDGSTYHSSLFVSDAPLNFENACLAAWPDNEIDTDKLVTIPELLLDSLVRASGFKTEEDKVRVAISPSNGVELNVSADGREFKEMVDLVDSHPEIVLRLPISKMLSALRHANRMLLTSRAAILYGRFNVSTYVAGYAS